MIDWRWLIPLSLAVGASIGWSLSRQRAARAQARLRSLLDLAQQRDCLGEIVSRDIAARIEAAGAGAESVPAGEGE